MNRRGREWSGSGHPHRRGPCPSPRSIEVKLVIVLPALGELHDAAAFYTESANIELGLAFVAEFERTVNVVLANPTLGMIFRGNRRRYFLRRFPYSVIYQVTSDELRVIAVAHHRRRPGYWAGRK